MSERGIKTVSEHAPCGICQGDSWCFVFRNGDEACYRATEGGEVKQDKLLKEYRIFHKEPREKKEPKPKDSKNDGPPDFTFDYVKPDGTPVLRVLRWEPNEHRAKKKHKQSSWRGNTWVPVGAKKTPLLYADRLADPAKADQVVFICEGEKKAMWGQSAGLMATSAPMGACKFNAVDVAFLELLRGKIVVILPDNDGEGFAHARQVAGILKDIAAAIYVLELPGLGPKGDLVDYLSEGGVGSKVLELAKVAPTFAEWSAKQGIVLSSTQDLDLPEVTGLALAALVASNIPAVLFVFGGRLARIVQGSHGAEVEPLEVDAMRGVMARANPWKVARKKGEMPVPPPGVVVRDVLTQARYPASLPILEGVLHVPTFSRAGELADQPGYNPCAHVWLDLPPELNVPPIPARPTEQHLARAREVLLEPLCDFPFADRSSRVHAVAASIIPFGRKLIRGPVPLFAVTSPSIGTGKSLLTTAIAWAATGQEPGSLTWTEEEEEFRKRVTAILREGPAYAILDNVSGKVDSATLASVLTQEWWKDRMLSTNSTLRLRNDTVWMFSANNPELSAELARRAALIRLDSKTAKPWLRSGFVHSNLKSYLEESRSMLVWAALVAWRAWLNAGRPLYTTRRIGSFESWGEVTGGVLEVLGLPGFLENYDLLWDKVEGELPSWEAFVGHWFALKGESETFSSDLFKMAAAAELLTQVYASAKTHRAAITSFGMALAKQVDRVFGDFRIERVAIDRCGRAVYRVVRVPADLWAETQKVCKRSASVEMAPNQVSADLHNLADLPNPHTCENTFSGTHEKAENSICAHGPRERSARSSRSAELDNHADSTPAELLQTSADLLAGLGPDDIPF